jgi:hypothetical protein
VFNINGLRSRQGQWLQPAIDSWNEAKKQIQLCWDLEAELERLERIHAEKLWILWANSETAASQHDYNRIRIAEGAARLDLEVARTELEQLKRNYQNANLTKQRSLAKAE